mgnify:CR=1 FL=1
MEIESSVTSSKWEWVIIPTSTTGVHLMIYILVGSLLLAIGMFFVGFIIARTGEEKRNKASFESYVLENLSDNQKVMLKYSSLTPISKQLVDGHIDARMIRDEHTTYRERQ